MKKLMMLIIICVSIVTFSQSYASAYPDLPENRNSKSVKANTSTRTQNKVRNVRRNKRQQGYNYYRYANSQSYLKYMGKAINGR